MKVVDSVLPVMDANIPSTGVSENGLGFFCNLVVRADNKVPLMKVLDVSVKAMTAHKAVPGVAMCGVYLMHGLAGKLSNVSAIKRAGVDVYVKEAIVTHAAVGDVKKIGESLLSKLK
jgi:hypothetical protein